MSTSTSDAHASTPPTTRTLITLDQDGDLKLLLGTEDDQQSVIVRKATLSLASPVWKAMFASQWSETTAKEIAFPDDDIEAVLIVLRIAHLRFTELPKAEGLSREQLLQLAIVCDKYDTARIVAPFLDLRQWAKPFTPSTYYGMNCHYYWIFIAWTFGWNDSFDSLAHFMVKHIAFDSANNPTYLSEPINPDYMPPGLLENMLQIRIETIRNILSNCYEVLDRILNMEACKPVLLRPRASNSFNPVSPVSIIPECGKECKAIMLGSSVLELLKNGLYPTRRSAEDVKTSIACLCNILKNIEMQTYVSYDLSKMQDVEINRYDRDNTRARLEENGSRIVHTACAAVNDLDLRVNKDSSGIRSPVRLSHFTHLEEQKKKCT